LTPAADAAGDEVALGDPLTVALVAGVADAVADADGEASGVVACGGRSVLSAMTSARTASAVTPTNASPRSGLARRVGTSTLVTRRDRESF
jgi:hypothetical protein